MRRRQRGTMGFAPPPPQHEEDAHHRRGIDEKYRPRSARDNDHTGDGRSDGAGNVDRDGSQPHARRQLLPRHDLGNHRLPRGDVDRASRADGERDHEEHPRLDRVGHGQHTQQRGHQE
jgi:hypothetical protein